MLRCPACGELVTGEREVCLNCGTVVPDPSRPAERRLRIGLIAFFVAGALMLIGELVRDSVLSR